MPRTSTIFFRSFATALAVVLTALASPSTAAAETQVPERELMAKTELPDIVQGRADAPVTLVEYASLTCPHCAHFHKTVYPTLLKSYIETGKVRFILREYPRDPLDTAGFMLARCEGPDKRTATVDLLFDQQEHWAFTDKPVESLQTILKQSGLSDARFEACLKDQALYNQLNEVRDRASKAFGIHATPTIFVNGTKLDGALSPDTLSKTLDPLINKKS